MSEKAGMIPKKLPWRIVVAGNLTPEREPAGPYSVDKNSFSELIGKLAPSLFFSVENTLGVEAKHLDVDLKIETFKDFTPDDIAEKVPELAFFLTVKETFRKYCIGEIKLEELQGFLAGGSIPERLMPLLGGFIRTSQAVTDTTEKKDEKKPESKGDLDNIMNMMDLSIGKEEGKEVAPSQKPIEGLFQSVGEGLTVKATLKDLDAVTQTVDEIITEQMNRIIHAPAFVAFETAWRELKFLIDRTSFREGVKVDVIACERGDLDTVLLEKVFQPVWNDGFPAPDLVVSTHALSQSAVDVELAGNLARLGQSTQTVILTWAGPKFFDTESFANLGTEVPSIAIQLNGTGYEKWRGLREKSETDWLAIATNGFYLRDIYGPEEIRSKTFQFNESGDYSSLPCGAGSIAVAAFLSGMFSRLGNDELLESKPRPELDNMPVASVIKDSSTVSLACVASLTNDQIYDMADSGHIPINCRSNDQRVFMESTTMYSGGDLNLPTMVMAGHIARIAVDIAQKSGEASSGEVVSIIQAALKKMLFDKIGNVSAEDYITVTVSEEDGMRSYEITADIPYKLLGNEVTVQTSFSL